MRLRNEIYEQGDSRDVTVSIEKFLGRKQSVEPFLKKIGIGGATKRAAGGAIADSEANKRSSNGASCHSASHLELFEIAVEMPVRPDWHDAAVVTERRCTRL